MTSLPVSVSALLATLDSTSDVELSILQLRLVSAGDLDPELPRATRLSALSTDIDPHLLAVLRGGDEQENRRLLELMVQEALVDEVDGVFRFHDLTRATLLREWHSSAELQAEFESLNRLLVTHFEEQLAATMELIGQFEQVSMVIQSANPERWARINANLDRRVSRAVRRAALHGFAVSPEDGMRVLRSNIDKLLLDKRTTVVDRLLVEAQGRIAASPDSAESAAHAAVLRYFRARWQGRVTVSDPAELEAVTVDPLLPADLRLWAMDDLATVYESDMQLADALRLRSELADCEADAWNTPLWWFSLGRLQWRLYQRRDAIRSLQRSIAAAAMPEARQDLVVSAKAMISLIAAELGRQGQALRESIEALDMVRVETVGDPSTVRFVIRTLANLLVSVDQRASQAAWQEGIADVPRGSIERIDALADRLLYLSDSGSDVSAAELEQEIADTVATNAAFGGPPGEVPLRRAYAFERRGAYQQALEAFDDALTQIGDEAQHAERSLDARLGRARIRWRCGEFDGALADLDHVRGRLERAGWWGRQATLSAEYARVAVSTGRLDAAATHLAEAAHDLEEGNTWEQGHRLRVEGELCLARADWVGADQVHEKAIQGDRARGDHKAIAETMRKLIETAEKRADWATHARRARRLSRWAGRLVAASTMQRASQARAAAIAAAEASVEFHGASRLTGGRLQDIATDLERARGLDPRCFWYPLTLSYVYASAGDWPAARRTLERALELAPTSVAISQLRERLLGHAFAEVLEILPSRSTQADMEAATETYLALLSQHVDRLRSYQRRTHAAVGVVFAALRGFPEKVAAYAEAMGRSTQERSEGVSQAIVSASGLISGPADYWRILALINQVAADRPEVAVNLTTVATHLAGWTAEWLGMTTEPTEVPLPAVNPIRLDVSAELVPLVDDRIDGGRFLFKLVPELRERVLSSTGVQPPVLRARMDDSLRPNELRVLLNNTEVLRAGLDPKGVASITPFDANRHGGLQLLPIHPIDRRPGPWALVLGEPVDGEDTTILPPEAGLAIIIELCIRAHLDTFIDLDCVAALSEGWRQHPELADLVDRAVPDDESLVRLTHLTRKLAAENTPLVPEAILHSLVEVESEEDEDALVMSVRSRLGERLPGRERGRQFGELPHAAGALMDDPAADVAGPATAQLVSWLTRAVAVYGPWLTVSVPVGIDRAVVQLALRGVSPHVAFLSATEIEAIEE